MKNEEKFLLSICQSYFNSAIPCTPENIDFRRLYSVAKNHNLIGICHCVFSSNRLDIPENVKQLFLDRFLDLVYVYEMQSHIIDELRECFSEADVAFILFKGAVLRDLYPVPEARSMGDIDILIKQSDRSTVKALLTAKGFTLCSCDGSVDDYQKNGVELEVHTKLFSQLGDNAFTDAFENAEFCGCEGEFTQSYHFAYLIAHTANHLKYTGAGIRFVLDLAVMLKTGNIDYDEVFTILDRLNLSTFAKALLSVCNEWFGCSKQFIERTDKIQEYLVSDGVFGSMKDNSESTVSRLMQCGAFDEAEEGKHHSSLRLKLRLAFPPYSTLRKAPYIKFLNGHAWLLPLAWLYRIIYSLKNNRRHMLETVRSIDDERTAALAKEELEFFKEIGLL